MTKLKENDKVLVLDSINQFSRCFIYSTAKLCNSVQNKTVLAVKQNNINDLAIKFLTIIYSTLLEVEVIF